MCGSSVDIPVRQWGRGVYKLWMTLILIRILTDEGLFRGGRDCGLKSPRRVTVGCRLGRVVLQRVVVQVNGR